MHGSDERHVPEQVSPCNISIEVHVPYARHSAANHTRKYLSLLHGAAWPVLLSRAVRHAKLHTASQGMRPYNNKLHALH